MFRTDTSSRRAYILPAATQLPLVDLRPSIVLGVYAREFQLLEIHNHKALLPEYKIVGYNGLQHRYGIRNPGVLQGLAI